MKILIIDDNESITNLFSKLAKMKGHECVVVNDGKSGLSMLENQIYDATILDVSMPEFSGIDVVNALAESGRIKEQTIVVLTASSSSNDDLDELVKKGVKLCLKKPMPVHTILATLVDLANKS